MNTLGAEYVVYPLRHIPIPMEDAPLHTDQHPYCGDPSCSCVQEPLAEGLVTDAEATRLAEGRQL
ncbi:MAG: hypothetical protein J2P36_03505 [Ktedonobacteraceae bacterium]|nr:hypothetical protein [Ktedonobacteraceae bacterium]